ncbi:hypothetical protein B0H14DRAFT_1286801 [Mycena olivaceomarginata]|nr:hypothetical protein B0H14DRAFT_1493809 [Mycena olivaceomarginata]KAJ7825499.1 hypothetical protein B0H14DRAFT_1286801 [Mycena olivaceomarginata]
MADVQTHTARLIALFVSCVLYGILLTTFVPCLRWLLFSASQRFQIKPRHEIKYPILAGTILMFFVSSFSAVISMQDVMDAFIYYQGPGGALEFYGAQNDTLNHGWTHWMPAVEDSVQVVIGDALLIYRCYVLYGRSWRSIVVPSVAWLGLLVTSILSSYREITLKPGEKLNDPSVLPILSAALLFTFATSVITTYLIIRRLLIIEFIPMIRGAIRPHILTRIATIFFETGLIYSLSVVLSLGIYLTRSNLEYVVSLAMIHIIPITCNLLLIRVEGVSRFKQPEREPQNPGLGHPEAKFNPDAANEV